MEQIIRKIPVPERMQIAHEAELAGSIKLRKVAQTRVPKRYGPVRFAKYVVAKLWARWSRDWIASLGNVEISRLWILIKQRGLRAVASLKRYTLPELICVFRYAKRALAQEKSNDAYIQARLGREEDVLNALPSTIGLVALHEKLDHKAESSRQARPWGGYRHRGEYSRFELRGPSCPLSLAEDLETIRGMALIPAIGLKALEIEANTRQKRAERQERAIKELKLNRIEIREAIKAGDHRRAERLRSALAAKRRFASACWKKQYEHYRDSISDYDDLSSTEKTRLINRFVSPPCRRG